MLTALNRIYAAGAVLAALCMVAIALLTLAQIMGRLFGVLIVDAGELAGFAMAGSIFFALAHTLRTGGHIRVNLLLARMRPSIRRIFEIWSLGLATTISGMFAVFSVRMVIESYEFHDVSTGMIPVPLWIPQLSMAAGAVLFVVALLHELILTIRGQEAGYVAAENTEPYTE
ncbi:MAG TPA: TRAP transporter small permease [Hyphomicrobiaceae bacterium]|jgi:TRAP-type C4-dicarboxylate transport system permease small subunit